MPYNNVKKQTKKMTDKIKEKEVEEFSDKKYVHDFIGKNIDFIDTYFMDKEDFVRLIIFLNDFEEETINQAQLIHEKWKDDVFEKLEKYLKFLKEYGNVLNYEGEMDLEK